jgi:hypothetical protein
VPVFPAVASTPLAVATSLATAGPARALPRLGLVTLGRLRLGPQSIGLKPPAVVTCSAASAARVFSTTVGQVQRPLLALFPRPCLSCFFRMWGFVLLQMSQNRRQRFVRRGSPDPPFSGLTYGPGTVQEFENGNCFSGWVGMAVCSLFRTHLGEVLLSIELSGARWPFTLHRRPDRR